MSGRKPFSILARQIDEDPERRRRVDAMKRAMRDARALTLHRAGHGLAEKESADSLNGAEAVKAPLEHEDELNAYLSTLRDYIEALGGELEITARFPDGEVIKVG